MMASSLLLLALSAVAQAAKLPSNWKKCPKINNEECLKEAIPKVLYDLKNGKKSLNMLPLDPLHFDRIEMSQGSNSPVNINMTFYNLDILGASRTKINSAKVDWDNYDIQIDADVVDGPSYLLGDYTIEGKVLVAPVRGKGKMNVTLENFSVLTKMKGSELIKNDKKYFNIDTCDFIIRSNKVLFDFVSDTASGAVAEGIQNFLNENWSVIMGELNRTISDALGLGVKQVASNLFSRVPVTELYA